MLTQKGEPVEEAQGTTGCFEDGWKGGESEPSSTAGTPPSSAADASWPSASSERHLLRRQTSSNSLPRTPIRLFFLLRPTRLCVPLHFPRNDYPGLHENEDHLISESPDEDSAPGTWRCGVCPFCPAPLCKLRRCTCCEWLENSISSQLRSRPRCPSKCPCLSL